MLHCEFLRHVCWHLKYFLCHPTSIIGCNCACFCSITWWIVSIALGNQATMYTLASYNFLCMVIMLNGWWLHGSPPKLTTASRAFNGYNVCQEAKRPASYIWLLHSLQRVLGLALTFLSDWRQKWIGQWVFARGGVSAPRGRCCCTVLCCIYLYQQKQEVSFINNHKTSSQSDLQAALYFGASRISVVLIWHRIISAPPPPQCSTKIPRRVFCCAIHGCRCNPSEPRCHKTVLAGMYFPYDITIPISVLYLFFSLALCLRYPCWHPKKRFHPSSQEPDDVAAL